MEKVMERFGRKVRGIRRRGGTGTAARRWLSAPTSRARTGLMKTRGLRQIGRQGASRVAGLIRREEKRGCDYKPKPRQ
jgi:hypothetical protein